MEKTIPILTAPFTLEDAQAGRTEAHAKAEAIRLQRSLDHGYTHVESREDIVDAVRRYADLLEKISNRWGDPDMADLRGELLDLEERTLVSLHKAKMTLFILDNPDEPHERDESGDIHLLTDGSKIKFQLYS